MTEFWIDSGMRASSGLNKGRSSNPRYGARPIPTPTPNPRIYRTNFLASGVGGAGVVLFESLTLVLDISIPGQIKLTLEYGSFLINQIQFLLDSFVTILPNTVGINPPEDIGKF